MKLISLIGLSLLTVACSSNKSTHSAINSIEVTEKLIKGRTTKAQVVESFGTPDVVEKTPEGDMWAYSRYSNESNSIGAGVSHYFTSSVIWDYTGVGIGGDKSSSSTKTASLVVYFKKDLVANYTFRTERF